VLVNNAGANLRRRAADVTPEEWDAVIATNLTGTNYMQAMLARIPLHRLATVEHVAAAVCYLAGPHAAAITGQTLVLDGGLTVA
jgi:NAD(P)-dependent dehydrogenase (short-subunit alcohol dehydrogenase family)